jgi:hypothetical protein
MAALIGLVTWVSSAVGLPTDLGDRHETVTDADCRDFANQTQAQVFYEAQGAEDPYLLDFDRDDQACDAINLAAPEEFPPGSVLMGDQIPISPRM